MPAGYVYGATRVVCRAACTGVNGACMNFLLPTYRVQGCLPLLVPASRCPFRLSGYASIVSLAWRTFVWPSSLTVGSFRLAGPHMANSAGVHAPAGLTPAPLSADCKWGWGYHHVHKECRRVFSRSPACCLRALNLSCMVCALPGRGCRLAAPACPRHGMSCICLPSPPGAGLL